MDMDRKCIAVLACTSILIFGSIFPAYAEVSSLKTNSNFYKGGSKIYFSGTIGDADPSGVTLVIFNPGGQFILLSSAIAGSDHTFQIIVDTSISDNQQKFSAKGIYNATAFIANQQNGKTVSFIYSPDGSTMAPSVPIALTASVSTSNAITLNWSPPINDGGSSVSGYKIERNDGSGFTAIQNVQSTTYQDTNLLPAKSYSYRVSAVNSAGTSDPSNVVTISTFSQTPTSTPSSSSNPDSSGSSSSTSSPSLEDLIQQRIEQAKKIQEQLAQAGKSQNLNLVDNMIIGDSIAPSYLKNNPSLQSQNNNPIQFDFGSIFYPIIAVIGAGIVGAILYLRKIGVFPEQNLKKQRHEEPAIAEQEDYAMMILKNRLAKGEITLEQFQSLKEVLLEP